MKLETAVPWMGLFSAILMAGFGVLLAQRQLHGRRRMVAASGQRIRRSAESSWWTRRNRRRRQPGSRRGADLDDSQRQGQKVSIILIRALQRQSRPSSSRPVWSRRPRTQASRPVAAERPGRRGFCATGRGPRSGGFSPRRLPPAIRVRIWRQPLAGRRTTPRTPLRDPGGAAERAVRRIAGLAAGSGPLGHGATYYSHAGRTDSHQVYLRYLNVQLKELAPGLSVQVGRMPYSSGGEAASGVPGLTRSSGSASRRVSSANSTGRCISAGLTVFVSIWRSRRGPSPGRRSTRPRVGSRTRRV